MYRSVYRIFCGVSIFLSLSFGTPSYAAGVGAGGGGDGIALSFHRIMLSVQKYLSSPDGLKAYPTIRALDFSTSTKGLVIDSTNDELRDSLGDVKDAINFPGPVPRIKLNRKRWGQLTLAEKRQLVFHEVLGLMRIERSNDYHLSSLLDNAALERIQQNGSVNDQRDPSVAIRVSCTLNSQLSSIMSTKKGNGSTYGLSEQVLQPDMQVLMFNGADGYDESSKFIASFESLSEGTYRLSIYRTNFTDTREMNTEDEFVFSGGESTRNDFVLDPNGKLATPFSGSLELHYTAVQVKKANSYDFKSWLQPGSSATYAIVCKTTILR